MGDFHVIRTTKHWQHLHDKSEKCQGSWTASAPVNNSRGRLTCLPGPGYITQHTWAQHRPRTARTATQVHNQQPHTPPSSAEHSASVVPEIKATIMSSTNTQSASFGALTSRSSSCFVFGTAETPDVLPLCWPANQEPPPRCDVPEKEPANHSSQPMFTQIKASRPARLLMITRSLIQFSNKLTI